MVRISKRIKYNESLVEAEKVYTALDSLDLVIKSSTAKFDETIEVAVVLGIDPRQTDQVVKGMINLPHGVGKTVRVAVFARDAKAKEASEAGADLIGADELIQEIKAGKIAFDVSLATPDMMPLVAQVAKILGPKRLMPTVITGDVMTAVKNAKFGQIKFRSEKGGIVHAGIGKKSFGVAKLKENLSFFLDAVEKARPSSAKGAYLKRAYLSSTMGIGIEFDINSFVKRVNEG